MQEYWYANMLGSEYANMQELEYCSTQVYQCSTSMLLPEHPSVLRFYSCRVYLFPALTDEGVVAVIPHFTGDTMTDDIISLLPPWASLSGLGGLEESEPLVRPSRKSFRLREEELRLSCTCSETSSVL